MCARATECRSLLTTPPHPNPHGPRSTGAQAEGPGRVWAGLLSGWDISNLYQPSRKAISAFLGAPPDLLLEDPVAGGSPPAWAPRRGRRSLDIDFRLVRGVFVRIWVRSDIVRMGIHEGWYPANTEGHRSRRGCRGCLASLGGTPEWLGHLQFMPTPSEGDFGIFGWFWQSP